MLPTKNLRSRQCNLQAGLPPCTLTSLSHYSRNTCTSSQSSGKAHTFEELSETPRFRSALFVSRARMSPVSASGSTPVSSAACTKLGILFQEFICSNFVSYSRSRPSAELQLVALRILEETHFRGKCLLLGSANLACS